ncbi:MAG: hypothetical protein WD512_05265 [Candidatus Paceibacterota bacterium]
MSSSEVIALEENFLNPNDAKLVFTSTRMNPPTPGHLLLISKLILEGIAQGTNEVYIVLSKKNTDIDNPMQDCQRKIYFLNGQDSDNMVNALKRKMISEETDETIKQKIQDMNVIFRCVTATQAGPFNMVGSIIYEKLQRFPADANGVLDIVLLVGDDRQNTAKAMRAALKIDNIPAVRSFDEKILSREGGVSLSKMPIEELEGMDMSAIPPSQISASLIRKLAYNKGLKNKFMDVYSDFLSTSKKEELYNDVLSGYDTVMAAKASAPSRARGTVKKTITKEPSSTTTRKARSSGGTRKKGIAPIKIKIKIKIKEGKLDAINCLF